MTREINFLLLATAPQESYPLTFKCHNMKLKRKNPFQTLQLQITPLGDLAAKIPGPSFQQPYFHFLLTLWILLNARVSPPPHFLRDLSICVHLNSTQLMSPPSFVNILDFRRLKIFFFYHLVDCSFALPAEQIYKINLFLAIPKFFIGKLAAHMHENTV